MRSRLTKQIVVCIIIVITVGIGAFLIKGYLFPDVNHNVENNNKEKYSYNEFKVINVPTEVLIQRYFNDFKEKMINSSSEAYKLLDNDTLEKFNSYEDFLNFINRKINKILEISIKEYTTGKMGNKTKYILVDQFGNQYTFIISAALVYKVNIDYSSNF